MASNEAARSDTTIYLIIISIFLFVVMVFLFGLLIVGSVQTTLWDGHIDIFWQMVEQSRDERDPRSIVSKLDYVSHYYPAGTIQTNSSRLEHITETSRKLAVELIIEELKRKTGEDLGYDPQKWIDRYRGGVK